VFFHPILHHDDGPDMQTRYGAVAAPPLRGVTPDAHKPGPTSHLEMRERGLVQCVAGPSDV